MPANMRLREPVQEHERRPVAGDAREDLPHAHVDPMRVEARKEVGKVVQVLHLKREGR